MLETSGVTLHEEGEGLADPAGGTEDGYLALGCRRSAIGSGGRRWELKEVESVRADRMDRSTEVLIIAV